MKPPTLTIESPSQAATRLRLVVARLARTIRQHAAAGLTPSQISALATLEDSGPMRISTLATHEAVGASVATRVVASLEELGYLQRADDPDDRRACLVALTKQGSAVLSLLWDERTMGVRSRLEALSAPEMAKLEEALPILEKLARDNF